MVNPWKIDVPVLLIFFKRDEQFKRTFEAVRKAAPKTLLLWQDGPREGTNDMEGILKCREIAESVDWDCEVHKVYNEKNYGCDPSTFYSHKWAFSIVDKCIVLEDDFVANESYFRFCKELLDKYEHDERINHICGMNILGEYKDYPYDYFFGFTGSNAWASWRRVVDGWSEEYAYLRDQHSVKNLRNIHGKRFDRWYKSIDWHSKSGIPYWESILCLDSLMNSRLAIIATRNMVENIGMTTDSTHSDTKLEYLTKTEKQLFDIPTFELDFPIKHPPYVVADIEYFRQLDLFFGNGHPLISAGRKIYHIFKYTVHGEIFKKIGRKFKKH